MLLCTVPHFCAIPSLRYAFLPPHRNPLPINNPSLTPQKEQFHHLFLFHAIFSTLESQRATEFRTISVSLECNLIIFFFSFIFFSLSLVQQSSYFAINIPPDPRAESSVHDSPPPPTPGGNDTSLNVLKKWTRSVTLRYSRTNYVTERLPWGQMKPGAPLL